MTELDRNLFINYRVGHLLTPYSYELIPFLTLFFMLKKANGCVYFVMCENGAWFVLNNCKRLIKYIKIREGNYD